MNTTTTRDNYHLLCDLQDAVEQLADAMHDEAPVANAIRGFARTIEREAQASVEASRPPVRSELPSARPVRDVLYAALDGGALDGGRFDFLMLAENRVARRRGGGPRRE